VGALFVPKHSDLILPRVEHAIYSCTPLLLQDPTRCRQGTDIDSLAYRVTLSLSTSIAWTTMETPRFSDPLSTNCIHVSKRRNSLQVVPDLFRTIEVLAWIWPPSYASVARTFPA